MRFDKTWLLALLSFTAHTAADPTWPSPLIDELEEIMFQTDSVNSRKFADSVSPCSNQANGAGRFAAAEWLRTAFHDMATHNRVQQTGGLDASIQYELNNGDNAGPAFATTLAFMSPFLSRRSSLSDLIALGVYTSVRTCRGPAVPFRPGRVDATGPGAVGVPQPQNAIGIFRNQFTRMGFTNQEMIQVTACGHTLGSVHSSQFPDLVPPGTTPNNQISMDSTVAVFDNRVVTEYLGWNTTNPLIVGRSVASGRNSDWKVFSSDANTTMNGMSDPAAFQAACKAVLQKMIDVVPPAATLGDPILPYQVKPTNMQLSVGASASVLELTGSIRIRTTELPRTTIAGLTITYKNRNGGSICGGPCSFAVNAQGLGRGIDDEFVWFPIAVNIPVATGISSFVVTIRRTDGTSATYDNNGNEYPLQDAVFLQRLQSCLLQSSGVSTFTAAIRNDRANLPARVLISYKVNQDNSPVPRLTSMTLDLIKGACIGAYTLFSVSTTIPGGHSAEADFDLISGTDSSAVVESFRKTRILGGTCRAFTSPGTCSTPGVSSLPSSTVSSTSSVAATSTVSTAAPVPSLYHRPTIGGYNLVSCWTEGTGARALGGATFVSADMTLERCMANCAGFDYWGTEYGVECYCGNSLHSSSNSAPLSECNMVCGGDSFQYCGAGNRIELYSTTATRSTTSVPAPTATLAHIPTIGKYSLVGCQTEGTGVRALTGAAQAADTMTLEMCADFCSSFTYFGTEYGRECYCGNSLHSSSTTAPLEQCNMVCAGNPFQYCGAGSRLELYRVSASDPISSVQAFSTDTSSQVSSDIPSSASPSSVAPSSDVASSADPSSEAPSSAPSSAASSEAPSSAEDSSVPASSAPSSAVSSVDESTVPASSAPPSSADVTTTTSSSTTTPTGPAHRPTIVPFTLVGCQTEGTGARALEGKSYASGTELTLEACASFCSGFRYFGTEYSAECYCGNALHPSSSAAPIADCAMLCSGNANEYCGGPNRLTLYEDMSIAPEEPAPEPRQPAVAGDFVFLGCRTEATGARALADRATASNTMSNEVCAAFCQDYQYFGTEYGAECYCGNVLNETSNEVEETDCSMLCSGADDEFCGNGNRLSVYVKQDSADE